MKGVFVVRLAGTAMPRRNRRAEGNPSGVVVIGRYTRGFCGNLGEPPASRREAVSKGMPHPKCPGQSGLYCHLIRRKETGNTADGIQHRGKPKVRRRAKAVLASP